MKCSICNKRFTPKKEKVYRVKDRVTIIKPFSESAAIVVFDAIDCPRCGCQHKLVERLPDYDENGGGESNV